MYLTRALSDDDTEVRGQTLDSLKPSSAVSVLGDVRTMYSTGTLSDVDTEMSGVKAEAFLDVRRFRDYHSFPIYVAGRLWGSRTIQQRPYDQNEEAGHLDQLTAKTSAIPSSW